MESMVQLIPGLPCEISSICLALTPRSHHGVMKQVSRRWNEYLNSDLFKNIRKQQGVGDKWFLVLTWMSNSWKAYCPELDRWGCIASIPEPLVNLTSFGTVVIKKQLYIIGGRSNMMDTVSGEVFDTTSRNEVWIYDVAKNEWSAGPALNVSRSSFACAVVDDKIFVAGGRDNTGRCLDSAEMFDTESRTWTVIDSMDSMRYFCYGFSLNQKFFVYQQRSSGLEMYDPVKKGWSKDDKVQIQGQCVVLNGKLYCLNGTGQIYIHDPFDSSQPEGKNVAALEPELSNYCYGRAIANIDGRLAIFGGTKYDGDGYVPNEIRFWDPLTKIWSKSAILNLRDPTVVGFAVVDV